MHHFQSFFSINRSRQKMFSFFNMWELITRKCNYEMTLYFSNQHIKKHTALGGGGANVVVFRAAVLINQQS